MASDMASDLDLSRDGLLVLRNVMDVAQLSEYRAVYMNSWETIKGNWDSLKWKKYSYPEKTNLRFIGQDIFEGKQMAEFAGTVVIDIGGNRYDFTYGLGGLKITNQHILAIVESQLKQEYIHYLGGLPIESDGASVANGIWHRDSYSLFDDDIIDIALPPWYMTVLVALDDIEDGGTEFILGSHKVSLLAQGITDSTGLQQWATTQKTASIKLKRGDVCIFNGLTIHRGQAQNLTERHLIYAVFNKNWYSEYIV